MYDYTLPDVSFDALTDVCVPQIVSGVAVICNFDRVYAAALKIRQFPSKLRQLFTSYTRSSFIFRGGLLVSGNLSVSEGTRYTYCNEQPQKFLVIQLYN